MKNNLQKVFGFKTLVLASAVMVMFFSQCKKDSASQSVKPASVATSSKKDTICCAVKTTLAPATTSKKDTICCAVKSFAAAKKDTICCAIKTTIAPATTTTTKKDTICCAIK